MGAVKDGDTGKLAILFERHHRSLFRFFAAQNRNQQLSDDLVQDVFFRMLRYRHSYNPEQSFTAWMYQIARNAVIDQAAKRKGEVISFEEYTAQRPLDPASADATPDQEMERGQDVRLLRRAMDKLPADKRELLILARYQELKYEEIAQILGCEVGTVKVRVFRAVKALGQIYQELSGVKAS
jgi:RNA polymerase sigma-70 factor (ECF subfamily)